MSRNLVRIAACVAVLVLWGTSSIVPNAVAQSAGEGIDVALTASGPLEVAQGDQFEFEIVVSNRASDPQSVDLILSLVDPAGGSIAFDRFIAHVGSGESATARRSVVTSRWSPMKGSFKIVAEPSEPLAALDFEVTKARITVPRFQDVTDEEGLTTTATAAPDRCFGDTYAAGAAWGDIDGDGDLDLYLPQREKPSRLWLNADGAFREVASVAGVDDPPGGGIGAVFADYDNDGDQDLYVTHVGANRLYQNDGKGHFRDVAAAAGVAGDIPNASAAWGDYDADGFLDLYVVNWGQRCTDGSTTLEWTYYPDELYHNNGDGTFTNVEHLLASEGSTMGNGLQASWFDYDLDGDIDLYLANDYLINGPATEPNVLWRNDGRVGDSWRFSNISSASGSDVAIHSMGVGIGDYDRDLDFDLAISNIGPTVLLRNEQGVFSDVAEAALIDRPIQEGGATAVTWGLDFHDLNNDGWEDLYVAAGELDNPSLQPNELFTNSRNGRFLDHSAASGTNDYGTSRGVAFGDYDRDGRMDLYVVNQAGHPHLYRNVTPRGRRHYLQVKLRGVVSNRDGCGALIKVHLAAGILLRQKFCGSTSFASGNDPLVHLGLGSTTTVRKVVVIWPSGIKQSRRVAEVDRTVRFVEPKS